MQAARAAGDVPDPLLIRRWLAQLVMTDESPDADEDCTVFDAVWPSLFDSGTGEECQRTRTRQKVQLGRYGHQPVRGWDDAELIDFLRTYEALYELMEQEGALTGVSETDG